MLWSADENELRSAIEGAAGAGGSQVLALLEERVRAGLSPSLLDVALDSLLLLANRRAAPLLVELAHHRRSEVRVRSLELLVQLHAAESAATLTGALADPEPEVRRAAARGLSEVGTHASFDALARAFEHDLEEATAPLARVASSADMARLRGYVGARPIASLQPLCAALLARRDIADNEKLALIEALASLGTDEARSTLTTFHEELAPRVSPRVRSALAAGAKQEGATP